MLSTSIEPPASPVSDHRRPAASAEKLLPHVTMLDLGVARNGSSDVDPHGAEHPQVLGRAPARLPDVVDRRVLQVARDRVEPQPSGRVGVGQPDRVGDAKRPPRRRPRHERRPRARPYEVNQLEDHPPVLVVGREVDVSEPGVEALRPGSRDQR